MIRVFADYDALSKTAADYVVAEAKRAIRRHGRFDWFVCGGHTPEKTYVLLSEAPYVNLDIWQNVHVFWGDERCVPIDDARSNFHLAKRCLLDHVPIPAESIHRIRAERCDAEAAAADYEKILPKCADLIMLGMGKDGHTASLFAESPALRQTEKRMMLVNAPIEPRQRVTITGQVLEDARRVLVLVSGADKALAMRKVHEEQGPIEQMPGRIVRDRLWFVDQAAVGLCKRPIT